MLPKDVQEGFENLQGKKESSNLKKDELILIAGLINFYKMNNGQIARLFSELPTGRNLSRVSVRRNRAMLASWVTNPNLSSSLGSKENFDKFFNDYFESRGLTEAQTQIERFSISERNLSKEDKMILVGLSHFYELSLVSIQRICKDRVNWFPNYTYASKTLEQKDDLESEVGSEFSKFDEDKFENLALKYLGFKTAEEMDSYFERYRERQIHIYTTEEKKIIYGLYLFGKVEPKKIIAFLKDRYPNLRDVTSKEISLLCQACKKIPNFVTREETEVLLGVPLKDLPNIFLGDLSVLTEKRQRIFSVEEKLFMIAWVDFGGSVENLKKFMHKYWNYNPKNVAQVSTSLWRFRQKFKNEKKTLFSFDEFMRFMNKFVESDFVTIQNNLSLESEQKTIDTEGLSFDEYRLYASSENCQELIKGILKYPVGNSVILPLTINIYKGKTLLKQGHERGLGETITIKIFDLRISKEDSKKSDLVQANQKLKGLIYLLTRKNRLSKLFSYWKSLGLPIQGIRLEILRPLNRPDRKPELVYRSEFVDGGASLESV